MISQKAIGICLIISIYILTVIISESKTNAFLFGGGGGGGGCCCCGGGGGGCGGGGGGCCSTTTTTCTTCGGRKKRAVLQEQLRTEVSDPCPQSGWKEIITKNIGTDAISSEYAVQNAMMREFEKAKFFVTCNRNEIKSEVATSSNSLSYQAVPLKFIANGEAYCSHAVDNLWCTVVALIV